MSGSPRSIYRGHSTNIEAQPSIVRPKQRPAYVNGCALHSTASDDGHSVPFDLRHLGRRVLARKYRNADEKRLGGTNEGELLVVNVLFDERAKVGREFVAIHNAEQGRDRPVHL